MRHVVRMLPAIAALAFAGLLVAAAADEKQAKPELSMVIIEKVKPSMAMQYEEATKQMCALLAEHGADPERVGFWTVSGPEIGYAFVIPLHDGFASMKPTQESWRATVESIGKERWVKLARKADACVESRSMIHMAYRADLSYMPEQPAVEEDEIKYVAYDFIYAFPGKEQEFEEIAQEWKSLYAEHGITSGWRVYEQVTGENLPVYLIAKRAKSELDYYKRRAAIEKQMGDDARALAERSHKLVRMVESKSGYPRPDLSYPTMMDE